MSEIATAARKHAEALSLVVRERGRQITEKGYDAAHDDQYTDGSLSMLAALLTFDATVEGSAPLNHYALAEETPAWVWDAYHHACRKYPDQKIRKLVIAAALIVADIERLQRLEGK